MIRPIRLPFVLALSVGCATLAGAGGAAAAATSIRETFTPAQLSHYASALVELERLEQVAVARGAGLPAPQRETLARQARSETVLIVRRNDLDPATFNAISRAVESDPTLRLKVHQAMMDKVVGT